MGPNSAELGHLRSNLANLAQMYANHGQVWSTFVSIRPSLVNNLPRIKFENLRPNLVEVDQSIWSSSVQTWSTFDQIWPSAVGFVPTSVELVNSVQLRYILGQVLPKPGNMHTDPLELPHLTQSRSAWSAVPGRGCGLITARSAGDVWTAWTTTALGSTIASAWATSGRSTASS